MPEVFRRAITMSALLLAGTLMVTTVVTTVADAAAPTTGVLGIEPNKPTSGPYVETEQGFMVPYTCRIPGTKIEFEMIPIAGGVVSVGAGEAIDGAEQPVSHPMQVQVAPYWIGKYEVQWDAYRQYMSLNESFAQIKQLRTIVSRSAKEGQPVAPVLKRYEQLWQAIESTPQYVDGVTAPTPLYDPTTTHESGEDPELPAVTMTPYAAKQFTKWLSTLTGIEHRLPSEAEWEHAARAGGKGPYGTGEQGEPITADKLEEYAWNIDNSDYSAHFAGELRPNAWGLYDMLGNAAEWVLDEHREEPLAGAGDGRVLSWNAAVAWPTEQSPRIAKGGFWDANAEDCQVTSRMVSDDEEWKESDPNVPKSPWWYADTPTGGVGMRLARALEPMDSETKRRVWEIDHNDIQDDVDIRLKEGRGKLESIDSQLPAALKQLDERAVQKLLN